MDKDIMRQLGYKKEMDRIEQKKCPFCVQSIDESSFRDDSSLREYRISGLCQRCQDETFGS